jgi:LPS-assembly protein
MRRSTRRAAGLAAVGVAAAVLARPESAAGQAQPEGRAQGQHDQGQHEQKPVLFSADEVTYDEELDIVTARGHVELSQSGRTLLADTASYNQRTDTVIATGNVSLIDDTTGETTFGNYVELHDSMKDGFIRDVRILLADRSRVAGNTARRSNGNRTEVVRGVYSPCDLCRTDPSAPPLWQIRAARVTHDSEDKLLEFYNSSIELDGFPLLWLPYMSHPDPTVKRKSGLLPFTVGNNSILGLYGLIPYYWVIDDDKDLTTTILYTSQQNTMLEPEYRQRFDHGSIDLIGGFTSSDPNPSPTGPSNPSQLRGFFFGQGEFDLDDSLRAGFNVNRVSDPVFLEEYKVGAYQNFLRSSIDLEDFEGRNYGSVFAYGFESLQSNVENRIQAVVLPVANYTWAGAPQPWGGRFTTTLDMLDLLRETGSSDRRLSLGTEFDLPFTILDGQRLNFLAALRGDVYYATSLPQGIGAPEDTDTERAFPQIGLEWRYPWVARSSGSTWLIEPRAAIYAAPIGLNPASIPNDDSGAVNFDDADLFSHNRFAGFDQVDSGQHVDYGLHLDWRNRSGASVDALFGQSYRFQRQSPFNLAGGNDGFDHQTSDYVGRIVINPGGYLDLAYHFRFNEADLRPAVQEVQINNNFGFASAGVTYTQLGPNVHDQETARSQMGLRFDIKLGTYWSTYMSATRDLSGDGHLLAAEIGTRYVDECTSLVASIGTDGYVIGAYKPGTTVMLQLVLKNLGVINLPLMETQLGQ